MAEARIGDRLKQLRANIQKTQEEVAAELGMTRASYSHLENNRNEPDTSTLAKLSSYYGVTSDYLIGNHNSPSTTSDDHHYYDLTEKDRRDIGDEIDRVLNGLDSKDEVNFYGEPMSKEDKDKMRMAMQTALEIAKREAKKKFTPKKYRDDTDA